MFDALKKGGVYGIVDHSAAQGSGTRDVETLHRIDEEVVKKEVLAAGFKLDAESDILRHPDDTRDWNSSPQRGRREARHERSVHAALREAVARAVDELTGLVATRLHHNDGG